MMENEEKRIREKLLQAEQEAHISDFNMAGAWERLEQKRKPGRKVLPLFYWSAAALLLLLCGLPFLWHSTPLPAPDKPVAVSRQPIPARQLPKQAAPADSSNTASLAPEQHRNDAPVADQKEQVPAAQQSPVPRRIPAVPAPAPVTQEIAVATAEPKALPQVSLAELMADEPAAALPVKSEPAVHIGIRKTIKVKPGEEPGTSVAHHVISIKL